MSGDPSPVTPTLTCLEIATTKVSAAVARSDGEHLVLLGAATTERKPRDPGAVAGAAGAALLSGTHQLRDGLEQAVGEVLLRAWPAAADGPRTLVLTSSSLGVLRREHEVTLEVGGRAITQDDLAQLSQLACEALPEADERVLWCAPRALWIDGVQSREDPVGRTAGRLRASMAVVSAAERQLECFGEILREAGWELTDFVACPVASALGVTTPEERDVGVVVIDIGAANTQLALYEGGALLHLSAVPSGVQGLVETLADELSLPIERARSLLGEHACALRWLVPPEAYVNVPGGRRIERRIVTDVVARALGESFEVIARQLQPLVRGLGATCVLTGGGSRLMHLVEYSEEMLGLPARVAEPALTCAAPAWLKAPEHAALVGLLRTSSLAGTEPGARTSLITLASRALAVA